MASRILSLKNGFKAAQMLGGKIVAGIGVYENYWIITDVNTVDALYAASRHPWLSLLNLQPCVFVQSRQDAGAWELLTPYVTHPVEDTPGLNGRPYLVGLASRDFIE